jgi:hypothetical protein
LDNLLELDLPREDFCTTHPCGQMQRKVVVYTRKWTAKVASDVSTLQVISSGADYISRC